MQGDKVSMGGLMRGGIDIMGEDLTLIDYIMSVTSEVTEQRSMNNEYANS